MAQGIMKGQPVGSAVKVAQDAITATNIMNESGIEGGDIDWWLVQVNAKCYFSFDGTDADNTDFYLDANERDDFMLDFESMTKLSAIADSGTANIVIQQMRRVEA